MSPKLGLTFSNDQHKGDNSLLISIIIQTHDLTEILI